MLYTILVLESIVSSTSSEQSGSIMGEKTKLHPGDYVRLSRMEGTDKFWFEVTGVLRGGYKAQLVAHPSVGFDEARHLIGVTVVFHDQDVVEIRRGGE